jgi:hypothetical protein
MHGGTVGDDHGRPVENCVYSKYLPPEWRDVAEEMSANPELVSLRSEIGTAQANLSRYLKMCEGQTFDEKMAQNLSLHLDGIGKLKEKEAKRIYQDSLVSELIAKQVQVYAAVLQQVLRRYVNRDIADKVSTEFADLVEAESGIRASVAL